jgi:hypothetical protein
VTRGKLVINDADWWSTRCLSSRFGSSLVQSRAHSISTLAYNPSSCLAKRMPANEESASSTFVTVRHVFFHGCWLHGERSVVCVRVCFWFLLFLFIAHRQVFFGLFYVNERRCGVEEM